MYPVRYEADFAPEQGRAKAFFRLILAVPWYILGSIYATAAFVVAFIAWFALLFTGRYPEGLYNFNAGVLRFTARANAFFLLQTEQWPPFGLEEAPNYPIRLEVDPPLGSYNRWKVAFRLIVGIPVMFMASLVPYLALLAATVAWLHIVFTGRSSGGIHNALTVGSVYGIRSTAYFLLMTETFPPVSDQEPAGSVEPGSRPKALQRGTASSATAPAKPKTPAKPKAPAKSKAPPKSKAAAKPRAKAATRSKAKPKPKPKPGPKKKS